MLSQSGLTGTEAAIQVAGIAVHRIAAAVEIVQEEDSGVVQRAAATTCAETALEALRSIEAGADPHPAAVCRSVLALSDMLEILEQNPAQSAKIAGATALVSRAFGMLCRAWMELEPVAVPETTPVIEERRQARRAPLEVHVGLQGDTNFFTGYTEDISDGGLFVATHEPLSVGTSIGIVLVLPEGRRVTASGRVAWIRAPWDPWGELSPGMGLSLHEVADADRAAILAFVARRAPLFYDC